MEVLIRDDLGATIYHDVVDLIAEGNTGNWHLYFEDDPNKGIVVNGQIERITD